MVVISEKTIVFLWLISRRVFWKMMNWKCEDCKLQRYYRNRLETERMAIRHNRDRYHTVIIQIDNDQPIRLTPPVKPGTIQNDDKPPF
jgi:hypothetical protein